MRKAINIPFSGITEKAYIEAYKKKLSNAKKEDKNPNYNGKLVTSTYRQNLSDAMTGKTIPILVRQKISETKRNGKNGNHNNL